MEGIRKSVMKRKLSPATKFLYVAIGSSIISIALAIGGFATNPFFIAYEVTRFAIMFSIPIVMLYENSKWLVMFITKLNNNLEPIEIQLIKQKRSLYSFASKTNSRLWSSIKWWTAKNRILLEPNGTVRNKIEYRWLPINPDKRAIHILTYGDEK